MKMATIFDKRLSYINYKETVRKLHNTGRKNSYHTSADVSMIGYGCGVYMYHHFAPVVGNHDKLGPCPRPWRGGGTAHRITAVCLFMARYGRPTSMA